MYTSVIGKQLVNLVNEKEGRKRTPKEFFDEIYFPIFYDHPKYLHWTINSPFVQSYRSNSPPEHEQRLEKLKELHRKITEEKPDASFAIGFVAAGSVATTSGQVTSLDLAISEDDIYSSWFGSGLGIGLEGGLVMMIPRPEIINILYEGWNRYRTLITETSQLKGNQIDTWNGQWLTFAFTENNYQNKYFNPSIIKKNEISIPTQSWIKVLFALAKKFPNEKLTAYVYSLGQTNTTVGFIQINLPEIKREIEMYNHLIGDFDVSIKPAIEEVYDTEYGFRTACQNGSIGLKEIEPKNIKEFMPGRTNKTKEVKFKNDEKTIINYNIYLSWVLAMLNDKSTIQKAEKTAEILITYLEGEKRLKTRSNKVEKLLLSTSRRSFIESITELLIDDKTNGEFFNQVVEEIEKMQANKFPHFLTLLKFKYNYLLTNNKEE